MLRVIAFVCLLALTGCVRSYQPSPTAAEVCAHISDASDRTQCETRLDEASTRVRPGSSLTDFGVSGFGVVSVVWYVAYYLVGLVFARLVYVDAKGREWLAFRVKPLWWAVLCLFDPAFGALVYWVLHYSRLVRRGYT